jgi:hypothetical protein
VIVSKENCQIFSKNLRDKAGISPAREEVNREAVVA